MGSALSVGCAALANGGNCCCSAFACAAQINVNRRLDLRSGVNQKKMFTARGLLTNDEYFVI